MERDDDVLEYYDQPSCIPLRYRPKSGRQTTQWHPPISSCFAKHRQARKSGTPRSRSIPWLFPCQLAISEPGQDSGAALREKRMLGSSGLRIGCDPLQITTPLRYCWRIAIWSTT